jgi:2-keto-4-pentenoate hydratase/2-oxohepta-3-ene-1,7-dioic acid hydratase in catechol pathway
MRLVTFKSEKSLQSIGALVDDSNVVVDLQLGSVMKSDEESAYFTSMLAFLQGGQQARENAQEIVEFVVADEPPGTTVPFSSVTLLAPVPQPLSIRDCLCFEQHIINSIRVVGLKKFAPLDEWIEKKFGRKRSIAYRANKTWYERPIYYKSNCFSVVGPGAEVRIPSYTRRFDYELEWGAFICKTGVDIPKDKARSYIGGYTIFNDFSARDIQIQEQGGRLGPAKGKDFDTGNAMGPCLVTPDEISDPYDLSMVARVNGEEWSRGTSADMDYTFEDLIEYISRSETLHPGEFLGSGTCSGPQGRGCGLELGKYLKAGDTVELEVENIGILRNTVLGS